MMRILPVILSLLLLAPATWASIDTYEFDNEVQLRRYQNLVDSMRCPYCENQALSGSDSPIAGDLRREIYLAIKDGRSDTEIIDFMVSRYGEYILYRPPLSIATLLLWFGPGLLLLGGIVTLIVMVRRRRRDMLTAGDNFSAEDQARLRELLHSSAEEDRS